MSDERIVKQDVLMTEVMHLDRYMRERDLNMVEVDLVLSTMLLKLRTGVATSMNAFKNG